MSDVAHILADTDAVKVIEACRSCGSGDLSAVFDLGNMPLSDGFTRRAVQPDPTYPLEVVMCPKCALAQLRHTVAPEILFADDYPYFSSYTATVVENARVNVAEAFERFDMKSSDLVVEIASNDGYLLKHVRDRGARALGIDPAKGPVEAARAAGVETVHAFFTEALAVELAQKGVSARLVFANNVLAHVADTAGFVRGLRTILADNGAAIIEAPYLRDLIDHGEFDTIYHEHLCYFSVTALDALFRANGLFLNDVKPLPIHGGSLRLFIERREAQTPRVLQMLADEKADGLAGPDAFRAFARRVDAIGAQLRNLLEGLRREGKKIAAYGAAAKGTILLNHFRIGPPMLTMVADKNPHKQGLYVPGVKLPVVSPEEMLASAPDAILILAWNHRAEIMKQLASFRDVGGVFVIPIPEPEIIR